MKTILMVLFMLAVLAPHVAIGAFIVDEIKALKELERR